MNKIDAMQIGHDRGDITSNSRSGEDREKDVGLGCKDALQRAALVELRDQSERTTLVRDANKTHDMRMIHHRSNVLAFQNEVPGCGVVSEEFRFLNGNGNAFPKAAVDDAEVASTKLNGIRINR